MQDKSHPLCSRGILGPALMAQKVDLPLSQAFSWLLNSGPYYYFLRVTHSFLGMNQFPGAAITKNHRLGVLGNSNLFFRSSRRCKSEVKGSAEMVHSEDSESISSMSLLQILVVFWQELSIIGLQMHHPISAFISTWHSPCMCPVCVQISPSYQDTSHIGVLLHYDLILAQLIIFAVTLFPNQFAFRGSRGQHFNMSFGGHSSSRDTSSLPCSSVGTFLPSLTLGLALGFALAKECEWM